MASSGLCFSCSYDNPAAQGAAPSPPRPIPTDSNLHRSLHTPTRPSPEVAVAVAGMGESMHATPLANLYPNLTPRSYATTTPSLYTSLDDVIWEGSPESPSHGWHDASSMQPWSIRAGASGATTAATTTAGTITSPVKGSPCLKQVPQQTGLVAPQTQDCYPVPKPKGKDCNLCHITLDNGNSNRMCILCRKTTCQECCTAEVTVQNCRAQLYACWACAGGKAGIANQQLLDGSFGHKWRWVVGAVSDVFQKLGSCMP
ncbi:unnamed protein product [Chrysoparadoxa australica]